MPGAGKFVPRGLLLFGIGTLFSVVLSVFQLQKPLPALQLVEVTVEMVYSKWWLLLICGLGSALIGLVYPCFDRRVEQQEQTQEWSRVLRCVAMFVGMNEACIKIEFPSDLQLSLSLAIMSLGLWWYFDRTLVGFCMGLSISVSVTLITQMLVYHGVCTYSEQEFSYMRSWLPSMVFSGGITIGNIGKQLAVNDIVSDKKHVE